MELAPEGLAEELAAGLRADREALREDVREAGGVEAWTKQNLPAARKLSGLPPDLSEQQLLRQTRAYYEDAEERARTCYLRCRPVEGGGCANQSLCLSPGQQPFWDDEREQMVTRECDRWPEYTLRQSLINAGVDERSASLKLGDASGLKGIGKVVGAFMKGALRGDDGWLVVRARSDWVGKVIAVGVLRNIRMESDRPLWYVDCDLLSSALKQFFADSQGDDPLDRPQRYQLVTFNNLNPSEHEAWLCRRLGETLSTRWSSRLGTLIVTRSSIKQLRAAYPMADEALRAATVCEAK